VIPARGGSKRVDNKNLTVINGKPLIAYAIETALQSDIFSKVIVNSDSSEILKVSEKYGAVPYERSQDLGNDTTFIIDVIKELIQKFQLTDEVCLGIMLPTCPLRITNDILDAYRIFTQHERKVAVVSVTNFETPIQLAQFVNNEGRLEPVFPADYGKSTRSTDHRAVYKFNEAIIFNSVGSLKEQSNLIGRSPIPYVMPPERSIIIDCPYQMEMIKLILSGKK